MIPRVTRSAISAATRRSAGALVRRAPALTSVEAPAWVREMSTAWQREGGGNGEVGARGGGDKRVRRVESDGYQRRLLTETALTSERREGAALDASSTGPWERHDSAEEINEGGDVESRSGHANGADAEGNGAGSGDIRSPRARRNSNSSGGSHSARRNAKDDRWRGKPVDRRGGGKRTYRRDRTRRSSGSDIQGGLWDFKEREYVNLMIELKESSDWLRAIEVYKQAAAEGELTTVMYNSTIGTLARSPHWRVALSIFQEMQDAGLTPDRFTFNSAILACEHGNDDKLAFSLFEEMPAAGVTPDEYTFSNLIAVCKKDRWEKALSLMRDMEQAGLKPGSVTYNAAIVACGNGEQPDQAVTLLDEMRERGVQVTEGTYSAAIAACGKAHHWEKALSLLEEMKDGKDNLEPNEYCYHACMSACARASRWAEALRLLREMQAAELTIRSGAYTQVIKACLNAREITQAEDIMDEMRAAGIHVKSSTLTMVTKYRESRSRGRRARSNSDLASSSRASSKVVGPRQADPSSLKQEHQQQRDMVESADASAGPQPTAVARTPSSASVALEPSVNLRPRQAVREFLKRIGEYARARRWNEIGLELEKARLNPEMKVSMRMYESCIAGLASGGRWSEAIGMLEKIHEAGLTPNARCVTAAIRACARSNPPRWGMAMSLLTGLKEPDVWAYVATFSALAKGGQWKTSVSLLEGMRGVGLEPNLYCYNSMLAAFRTEDPPQWQRACALLVQMKDQEIEPNRVSYTCVVQACLAASEFGAAKSVMEEMVEAGHPPAEELKSLVVQASSNP